MRESTVEKAFVRAVKKLGGEAPKWTSPGNAGVPDRIALLPHGRVYFVELKAPGKKLRPIQVRWLMKLDRLGHKMCVLDSVEAVEAWAEDVMNGDI